MSCPNREFDRSICLPRRAAARFLTPPSRSGAWNPDPGCQLAILCRSQRRRPTPEYRPGDNQEEYIGGLANMHLSSRHEVDWGATHDEFPEILPFLPYDLATAFPSGHLARRLPPVLLPILIQARGIRGRETVQQPSIPKWQTERLIKLKVRMSCAPGYGSS